MKSLILGSAGQIGSALVDELTLAGHETKTWDIKDSEEQDLRFWTSDFAEAVWWADMVYFLAFDVGGSKYLQKYQGTYKFLYNNVCILDTVFSQLERVKTPFLFASSQMSALDNSSYGTLKALGEHYTKSLGGFNAHFWNVYGYEPFGERAHVVNDFIQMALEDGEICMRTTGLEERQFLYAPDCARALRLIGERRDSLDATRPYHVTSFEWTKILTVAEIVASLTGADIRVGLNDDSVQQGTKRDPDEFILGMWGPVVSLNEGIGELVERYR